MSLSSTVSAIAKFAPTPPQINWVPSSDIQMWSTRAAFVIALIWLLFLIMQFAIPSKRGGGMGRGGAAKFIGAAVVILVLMDLKLLPTVINNVLNILWYLGDMIGIKA